MVGPVGRLNSARLVPCTQHTDRRNAALHDPQRVEVRCQNADRLPAAKPAVEH